MPRDARAYLWDAREAAEHVASFVTDRSWEDYEGDVLLRSAVERQLEIVGEALNQLRQVDPAMAAGIEDLPRVVAFRNILAHGYAVLDDRLVWEVATEHVGRLASVLDGLLGDR